MGDREGKIGEMKAEPVCTLVIGVSDGATS